MKPSIRDYLAIGAALLAIFLCGYGIGFLFGERKEKSRHAQSPPPSVSNWEAGTLEKIEETIELTPSQLEEIRAEIEKSAVAVEAARSRAKEAYAAEFMRLNERLRPHLTPEQWESLQAGPNPEPQKVPQR